mmetsp:Transcript_17607/g.38131  ORF Transcript_17607/g.38131 Transcript_17607/m.38131 type:complete len:284 (+) Transcript_17607:29-880(+)
MTDSVRLSYRGFFQHRRGKLAPRLLLPRGDCLVAPLTKIAAIPVVSPHLPVVEPAASTLRPLRLLHPDGTSAQFSLGDVCSVARCGNLILRINNVHLRDHEGCAQLVDTVRLDTGSDEAFVPIQLVQHLPNFFIRCVNVCGRVQRGPNQLVLPGDLQHLIHVCPYVPHQVPPLRIEFHVRHKLLRHPTFEDRRVVTLGLVWQILPYILGHVRQNGRHALGEPLQQGVNHRLAAPPAKVVHRRDVQPVFGDVEVEIRQVGGGEPQHLVGGPAELVLRQSVINLV